MYTYSKPFTKEQAVDFMLRPISVSMTEPFEFQAFMNVKEKLNKKSLYEIFMMFRAGFPEHHIVRFGPEKLAFKYYMS